MRNEAVCVIRDEVAGNVEAARARQSGMQQQIVQRAAGIPFYLEEMLRMLMDKAEQSTGGAIVNVIAYQAEYAKARDELKVLEATARSKNCKPKQ